MKKTTRVIRVGGKEDKSLKKEYLTLRAERKTFRKASTALEREKQIYLSKYKPKDGASAEEKTKYMGLMVSFFDNVDPSSVEDRLQGYPESLVKQIMIWKQKQMELMRFKKRIDKSSSQYNEEIGEIAYQKL